MPDATKYGVIGALVMLIAAMGGTMYLSQDELDKAYICTTNQRVGIFDNLSSTMKTGYFIENNAVKSSVCTNGAWVYLKDYAQENNIDINLEEREDIVEPVGTEGALKYSCNQEGCKRI